MPFSFSEAVTKAPHRRWLVSLLLFLSVTGIYLPSVRNDFIYDDFILIVRETTPQSFTEIFRVFRERHWHDLPYYRPLSRLTMVIQKYWHGNRPGPYHAFNALVIAACACLAFGILRLPVWNIRTGPAVLAAALFALHPVASSTVYPICSGRETMIPALFMLAAIYSIFRHGWVWYVVAMVSLVLALFSKEQAIVLPPLFVVADMLGLTADSPGKNLRRWMWRYVPIAVIVAAYLLIRWQLFGGTGEHRLAIWHNPSGPMFSLAYALQSTFAPHAELRYEPTLEIWFSTVRFLMSIVAVVVLGWSVYRQFTSVARPTAFWLVWIMLCLLPTANVLDQEVKFAERYVFLSLFGALALIAILVNFQWQIESRRRRIIAIASMVVTVCAVISFLRGTYFRDSRTFLDQWVHTDPNSFQAHLSLGAYCYDQDNYEEAMVEYNRALELNPESAVAHNYIGLAYAMRGDFEKAIVHGMEAVRRDPDVDWHYDTMGTINVLQGKLDEAAAHYKKAIHLKPANAMAHYKLGRVYLEKKQYAQAIDCFHQAIRYKSDHAGAYHGLGVIMSIRGKWDEATEYYQHALRINPGHPEALNNLGDIYKQRGDLHAAARHYEHALKSDPNLSQAEENLKQVQDMLAAKPNS